MTAAKPAFDTESIPYTAAAIANAAALILRGGIVAVPTETVYGLAADATNNAAVARIYEAKQRPAVNPLIVHVLDLAAAETIAVFDRQARMLAADHWPGPLTLVLPLRLASGIAPLVVAGLPTIAIRVPAHPAIRALLAAVERPLAAPSANASGSLSPTTADHVRHSLGGRIAMIIDGGQCRHGLESTIVAVSDNGLRLLRPGAVDLGLVSHTSRAIEAPGQLAGHYAPSKPLRLNAATPRPGEWLIGFGAVAGHDNLSATGDLHEAATNLFAMLHHADRAPMARIAVAPVPAIGLGVAINDRLARAAA